MGPEKEFPAGKRACPFTRHPIVLAPICVADGNFDNSLCGVTDCFLHEPDISKKLKIKNVTVYTILMGVNFNFGLYKNKTFIF
jgi:hypothetical protein